MIHPIGWITCAERADNPFCTSFVRDRKTGLIEVDAWSVLFGNRVGSIVLYD
ncbi:MAG: hypothetical protein HYR81_04740 [Nitrospirae bacterium]|nr:hypothetical protein [Nitrospirota bacterium]